MASISTSGAKITIKFNGILRNTLDDNTVAESKHPVSDYSQSLANGVLASRANRAWQSKNRTLSSGANEVLDLYDMGTVDIGAGAGLDGNGQAVAFEEIVGIMIVNENAVGVAGQLEIEPDATNGWAPIGSHTAATGGALRGQGCLVKSQVAEAGFDVTDASSHRIKLTANGGDVTYSIYLLARHDDDESSSSSSSQSSSSSSSQSSSSSSSTS